MIIKERFWAMFRLTCVTPRECSYPQIPSACRVCGWNADEAWKASDDGRSWEVEAVDEIMAEEANEPKENHES